MTERRCLIRDEQDDWYCIPVSLRRKFRILLAMACSREEEVGWQRFDDAFDQYRLVASLEDYTFTDWEESE